jgi:hypothetical protein
MESRLKDGENSFGLYFWRGKKKEKNKKLDGHLPPTKVTVMPVMAQLPQVVFLCHTKLMQAQRNPPGKMQVTRF